MTPEQELELLIAEQEADDTYFVRRPSGEISLDSPAPDGLDGTVADYIGVTYDFDAFDPGAQGEVVDFLPREEESLFLVGIPHGTVYAYNRLECRCAKCKSASAERRRLNRAKAKERAES